MMRRSSLVVFASALALWVGAAVAAGQSAAVGGNWNVTIQTRRGAFNQTMTIQQNGNKIKGTIQGRRGSTPFRGSVDGHKISFTVTRQGPRGTMTMTYNGTVHGESMKGTAGNSRFTMNWTAQRGSTSQ